jgi:hypothetical protein
MLECIPHVTESAADGVLGTHPTLRHLFEAYEAKGNDLDRDLMLKDIVVRLVSLLSLRKAEPGFWDRLNLTKIIRGVKGLSTRRCRSELEEFFVVTIRLLWLRVDFRARHQVYGN